jgi:hypothetical protein
MARPRGLRGLQPSDSPEDASETDSFGRKDNLDPRQTARLSVQLTAYLETENSSGGVEGVDLTVNSDFGGPLLLGGLWRELKLDEFFGHALRNRRFDAPVQQAAEDRAARQEIVGRLQEEPEGSHTAEAHTRKACTLLDHRGCARYLRETEKGAWRSPEAECGTTNASTARRSCSRTSWIWRPPPLEAVPHQAAEEVSEPGRSGPSCEHRPRRPPRGSQAPSSLWLLHPGRRRGSSLLWDPAP